jgi:hypothetical protein
MAPGAKLSYRLCVALCIVSCLAITAVAADSIHADLESFVTDQPMDSPVDDEATRVRALGGGVFDQPPSCVYS